MSRIIFGGVKVKTGRSPLLFSESKF